MMRKQPRLLCALSALWLAACGQPATWVARTTEACQASTSDPDLDRQRTYLATLLALQMRGYAILREELPNWIEADFSSDYKPAVSRSRWVLMVGPDASLTVDVPPDRREVHSKAENWYRKLLQTQRQLQCRELNWLRWEAQNRGLLPIGAAAGSDPSPATGEQASAPPPTLPLAAFEERRQRNVKRLVELETRRAQINVARPFVWAGVGGGLAVVGLTFTVYGAAFVIEGCRQDPDYYPDGQDCTLPDVGRIMLPVGAGLVGAGATMLAIGLPRGFARVRESRALGREIKLLRNASLGLAPAPGSLGVSWTLRGKF